METTEALKILRLRLGVSDLDAEQLLTSLLDEARGLILAYTRRTAAQWRGEFDAVWIRLAAAAYQRLGAEGYSSRSEGGVSTAFADGIPGDVARALDSYRLVKGI